MSDKAAYIVALKEVTSKFPLYSTGATGFTVKVMERMLGESDERRPVKEDKLWVINYSSILAAEIAESERHTETLFIRSGIETWEVRSRFEGTLEEMATGVNMGISGKLAAIWTVPSVQSKTASEKSVSTEVIDILKKLGELKDAGVLTEAEFDQKKKDLLSRL